MTEKIEWKKEYELGVPLIDGQHKKLVDLAGDLYDALTGDPEQYKQNLAGILKALGDYTVYHFSTEEALIEEQGYPGIQSHRLAHKNFTSQIENQMKRVSDSTEAGFKFYDFVLSWLLTHILKADKLWADFIAQKESEQKKAEG